MQSRQFLLTTLMVLAAATACAQAPALEFQPQAATAGQAVVVPVPDKFWQPQGTLAFRLQTSRTLRFSKAKPLSVPLVKCPLFTLTLTEHKRHLVLKADLAHDGSLEVFARLDESGKTGVHRYREVRPASKECLLVGARLTTSHQSDHRWSNAWIGDQPA